MQTNKEDSMISIYPAKHANYEIFASMVSFFLNAAAVYQILQADMPVAAAVSRGITQT